MSTVQVSFSRRGLMNGSLVAVAATAIPVAAAANASSPDAALIDLARECLAAKEEEWAFARDVLNPSETRYFETRPDPSEALIVRDSDGWLLGAFVLTSSEGCTIGRHDSARYVRIYSIAAIQDLRTNPRMCQDHTTGTQYVENGKTYYVCGKKPNPKAQARADEIVAAYDEWRAADAAAIKAAGLDEAEAISRQLAAKASGLIRQVMATRATTLQGLMLKAQCAERASFFALGLQEEIEDNLAGHDPSLSLGVAASIARDLIALSGGEP